MKTCRSYAILLIIPFFILSWGFFYFNSYETFYSHNIDPEYPYLLNGLNVALLEFNRIGHFDHPGTPFQVYCGVIIRITHLFTGKEAIAQDVFNRPDYYLSAIHFSLTILQSLLCLLIAFVGRKREVKIWQIVLLQSGVFLNALMLGLFCRVIPERWFVVISLLFIIIYLLFGYKDKNPLKFAIWSGIIMGMGLATKFNFLPLLLLPLLLIDSNKNRLIYTTTGIASFIIFLLPIINRLGHYRSFLVSIATHDGIYGQGTKRMFDPLQMKNSFFQMLESAPELIFITFSIITAIIFAILNKKNERTNRYILLFTGIFFIILLQTIMVSKHFKITYLVPLITFYPLFLFLLDSFIQKIGASKKWSFLPVILLFVIFTGFTANKILVNEKYRKMRIIERETMRMYVSDNLASNTFWFVEPTWENAPYVENGIVYGLCYSHCKKSYINELINKNPNIITYIHSEDSVGIWRRCYIPIDSVVVTGVQIHLFSSPGRNAKMLMEILEKAALRNDVTLATDTLFYSNQLRSHIIVMQNQQSAKTWKTENFILSEAEIQQIMLLIYNTPEWLEKVEKKALENNIPLDSMVYLDAVWILKNP